MSATTTKPTASAKGATARPFEIDVPEDDLADLRRRIAAVRWPSKELVDDRSQGVQLATIKALARYWTTDYDWRQCEARLNTLPQYKTEVDGEEVHFIHVKSPHKGALPLILTHGWPGSIIEMLEAIGPLTDPTAHGGSAEDAFDLVVPSIPGYAFSAEPTELGWSAPRAAQAWGKLMPSLGYTRYVAQGGDVGAAVTDAMGRQGPVGLIGIHMNLFVPALINPSAFPVESDEERTAADAINRFRTTGNAYLIEQNTRPQTIGYALLDSPVAPGSCSAQRAEACSCSETRLRVSINDHSSSPSTRPRASSASRVCRPCFSATAISLWASGVRTSSPNRSESRRKASTGASAIALTRSLTTTCPGAGNLAIR